MRKLDAELEKFRLELEADNSGITEQIEHKTEVLLEKGSSAVKAEKRRQGFRFQRGSNFKTPFLIHRKIIGHACRTALRSSNVRPFGYTHKSDGFRNGSLHGRVGHSVKHGAHMKDPSMTQAGIESVDDHGRFRLLQPHALSDVDTPDSDDTYDSKSVVAAYPPSRSEFNPAVESDFVTTLSDPPGEIPASLSCPSASPLTPKLSPFFTFPTPNLVNCEQNSLNANRYHQTRLIGSQGSLAAVSSAASDHGDVTVVSSQIGTTSTSYGGEHRLYSAQSTSPPSSCTPTDPLSRHSRIQPTSRDRRVRNPKRATAVDGEAVSSQASSSSRTSSSRSLALFMPSTTGGLAFDDAPIDQVGPETAGMLGSFLDVDGSVSTGAGEHSDLPMLAGGVGKGAGMDDVDQDDEEEEDQKRYCLCRDVSYGDMIACDAPNCPFEWFHYHCVNLTVAPKGNWFCPNCIKNCIASKNKKRLSRR